MYSLVIIDTTDLTMYGKISVFDIFKNLRPLCYRKGSTGKILTFEKHRSNWIQS